MSDPFIALFAACKSVSFPPEITIRNAPTINTAIPIKNAARNIEFVDVTVSASRLIQGIPPQHVAKYIGVVYGEELARASRTSTKSRNTAFTIFIASSIQQLYHIFPWQLCAKYIQSGLSWTQIA